MKDNDYKFRRTGDLSRIKLLEYIPSMILTNLSTLLLISVDGLVVGNLNGKESLSSVNVFYPAIVLIGVVSILLSSGIATTLSTCFGSQNKEKLDSAKKVSFWMTYISAFLMSIVQLPIVYAMVRLYHLSPELEELTWKYARGIMFATPLGLISCVGTYEFQIAGKIKYLMYLSISEGCVNLIFDLIFVGPCNMGVAGAGYGTLVANIVRCSLTIILLAKKTSLYHFRGAKFDKSIVKEIFVLGLPDGARSAMQALQKYFLIGFLVYLFGSDGGVIQGVCTFIFSCSNVITSGIKSAVRPMAGLYCGAQDRKGISILMKQGFILIIASTLIFTFIVEFFPSIFYFLHGVTEIPNGGILSVRLYVTFFMLGGINDLFLLYLTNRKDTKFATILTFVGNASMILFAFVLMKTLPAPFIWLSYFVTECVLFIPSLVRYLCWKRKDENFLKENTEDIYLSLSVDSSNAIEVSRKIRNFAKENGISDRISYRVALCMEEMVVYTKSIKKTKKVFVQISIVFKGKNEAIFVIMDNGVRTDLDKHSENRSPTVDNYEIMRRIATDVKYQYILNMNYAILRFCDKSKVISE